MQDSLFLVEKKEKSAKTPHTRCPLCGGKIKAGQIIVCKKCGFLGTEQALIEKINKIYTDKAEENSADAHVLIPVFFFCGAKAKINTQKIKSFGYKAYCYVSELLFDLKPEQRVYLVYDDTVSDNYFFQTANRIFPKSQNILAVKIQPEQLLNVKTRQEMDSYLKESFFSAFENVLFQMKDSIQKLERKKQEQLINSLLSLSSHIKNPEIHIYALDRLLYTQINYIVETVYK